MVVENVLHGIMCKFLRNPQLLFCEIKSLNMDLIETDANFTNDSLLAGFVLFFSFVCLFDVVSPFFNGNGHEEFKCIR